MRQLCHVLSIGCIPTHLCVDRQALKKTFPLTFMGLFLSFWLLLHKAAAKAAGERHVKPLIPIEYGPYPVSDPCFFFN